MTSSFWNRKQTSLAQSFDYYLNEIYFHRKVHLIKFRYIYKHSDKKEERHD